MQSAARSTIGLVLNCASTALEGRTSCMWWRRPEVFRFQTTRSAHTQTSSDELRTAESVTVMDCGRVLTTATTCEAPTGWGSWVFLGHGRGVFWDTGTAGQACWSTVVAVQAYCGCEVWWVGHCGCELKEKRGALLPCAFAVSCLIVIGVSSHCHCRSEVCWEGRWWARDAAACVLRDTHPC